MATIDSVERDIKSFLEGLSPKELRKALRKGVSREARRVRKAAINKLKSSTIKDKNIHNAAKVGRTIRAVVKRDLSGFRVDARFGKDKGFYKNSRGKLKPVAFWLQHGVGLKENRKTRKKGRNRGSIDALGYMDKTKDEEISKSARQIAAEFQKAVEKIKNKTFRK